MEDRGGVDEEGVVTTHSAIRPSIVEPCSIGEECRHYASLDRLWVPCSVCVCVCVYNIHVCMHVCECVCE